MNMPLKSLQVGTVRIKGRVYPLMKDEKGRVFYEVRNKVSGLVERQLWLQMDTDPELTAGRLLTKSTDLNKTGD